MADAISLVHVGVSAVTGLVTGIAAVFAKPRIDRWHNEKAATATLKALIADFRRHCLESWRVINQIEKDGFEPLPLIIHFEKLRSPAELVKPEQFGLLNESVQQEASRLHTIARNYNVEVRGLVDAAKRGDANEVKEYCDLVKDKLRYLIQSGLEYPLPPPAEITWEGQPKDNPERPKKIHRMPK